MLVVEEGEEGEEGVDELELHGSGCINTCVVLFSFEIPVLARARQQ